MNAGDSSDAQGRAKNALRAVALTVALIGAEWGGFLAPLVPLQGLKAQEDVSRFLRIAAGPPDAPAYQAAELLAAAVTAPLGGRPCDKGGSCGVPGLVAVAQSVDAPEAGLALLRAGQVDVVLAPAASIDAVTAQSVYTLGTLYSVDLHVLVPEGSAARGLADLTGKRLAVAVDARGGPALPRALIRHLKLVPGDGHVTLMPRDMGLEALKDGSLDALFVMTAAPAPAIAAASEKTPLRLIPVYAADLPEAWSGRLRPVRLNAELYKTAQGADTVGAPVQLLASAKLEASFARQITQVLWSQPTQKILASGPPETRSMRVEGGLTALVAPLHPGAAEVYRQMGLLKDAPTSAKPESAPAPPPTP